MSTAVNPALSNGPRAENDAVVLTLGEAAAFLRVPEEDLKRDADGGLLPGRLVAGQWRFVKQALADWLSSAVPQARQGAAGGELPDVVLKARRAGINDDVLSSFGAFADDETLEPLVEEIYRARKRNVVGGG
jgi:hypothetical protein